MIKRITATVILLVIAAVPGLVAAESLTEYEIAEGFFYAQGNSPDSSTTRKGYRLTNEDDIPFFSEFRKLGGVPALGYPVSRRFKWQNRTTQLTQRAVLQWDDVRGKVVVFDILDYLSERGWDVWLKERKSIPRRLVSQGAEDEQEPNLFVKTRLALLNQDPQLRSFYHAANDPVSLYGLPTSNAEDFGPFVVMRFQRMALQRWKVNSEWAKSGDILPVNVVDIANELGMFPESAVEPEDAPEPAPRQLKVSSRGTGAISRGVATWYGKYFQGRPMRNGEIYDMWDPTTTASNTHPLGTMLRVTSVATGKSIVVEVRDTGAFRYPIIVDLSWAAFSLLADPDVGVIEVTVEPLRHQ